MDDPICHALQGDGPDKKYDEHEVGIDGCDVDDRGVLRDTFDDAEVDQTPGQYQRCCDGPVKRLWIANVRWYV